MNETKEPWFIGKKISAAVTGVIGVFGIIDVIRYIILGNAVATAFIAAIYILLLIISFNAFIIRFPIINLVGAALSVMLFFYTNNFETTFFNFTFMLDGVVLAVGGTVGMSFFVKEKISPDIKGLWAVTLVAVYASAFFITWTGCSLSARGRDFAQKEIWAVPEEFDGESPKNCGRIEKIEYTTKSYAVDKRDVRKTACVYLPYGYTEDNKYDILYLLHGTGDDEEHWLIDNPSNKVLLDNMIDKGVISPLIVVTPTFYVEDDCMDGLDPLTYSFKEELKNDLMPAVEGKYSTYSDGVASSDFIKSRNHRAFAGLSRGAVTTLHSVFCGALDYFSYFGTFSGSRTSEEYFKKTALSDEFKDYSINYYYVATGNFDFALPAQVGDYKTLLSIDDRIKDGVNGSLDIFPMRYHSMGLWHLALYNYLQLIF